MREDSPEGRSIRVRDQTTADMIERHGWEVQGVEQAGGWVYTVGLVGRGLPELLLTGVPHQGRGVKILNDVARWMIEHDRPPRPGERVTVTGEAFTVTDQEPDARQLPQAAHWWGNRLRALRVVPVEPAAVG